MKKCITDTTTGTMFDYGDVKKELVDYFINRVDEVNYEFPVDMIIITGYNETEKNLTRFDDPIVVEDHKGNLNVALDLRSVMLGRSKEKVKTIIPNARIMPQFKMDVVRALVTRDLINDEFGKYIRVGASVTTAFTVWLSNGINSRLMLEPEERLRLDILIGYYAACTFYEPQNKDDLNVIISRLATKRVSFKTDYREVSSIVEGLPMVFNNLNDLVDILKERLGTPKVDMISKATILDSIVRSTYGVRAGILVSVATEHIPTFIALMYVSLTDRGMQKTLMGEILKKNEKTIDGKAFIEFIEKEVMEPIRSDENNKILKI